MELDECKELVLRLRDSFNKELDASTDACNTIDDYFSDLLSDIQYFIDQEEANRQEENPERSDFEEHNTLNHAQLGLKR